MIDAAGVHVLPHNVSSRVDVRGVGTLAGASTRTGNVHIDDIAVSSAHEAVSLLHNRTFAQPTSNRWPTAPVNLYRPSPDSAVRKSLRYTVAYMLVSFGLGIIGLILLAGSGVHKAADQLSSTTAVVGALGFLGWVGFFFGMEKGGYFLLDHYLTRVFLWRRNRMPWDYMQFLDTAAERILLRKVGAGYMFVHRMLLEYFADRWSGDREAAGPQPANPKE